MSKTILAVDDSNSIRVLIDITLSNAGYKVIIAADGDKAIEHLNGQHIDLIITDLNMPNLDGISLIKQVRTHENYSKVPILLLSTESQAVKKEEAKAAGATGWLVKPFEHDKLLAVVKKVIR